MISRSTSSTNYSSPFQRLKSSGKNRIALFIASILLIVSAASGTFITLNFTSLGVARADGGSPVLTYKGDNYRTGESSSETILNKSNVNTTQFGKRVSYPVDGQIYTQPLYVPGLTINGSTHNVTFVETENDSVYAFDADQTTPTAPLWSVSLLNGGTPASNLDVSCNDMTPSIGITGTPVIDSSTNTMYLVALTKENGNLIYRLYALDITTGQSKVAPTVIQGSVPGTGKGSVNGTVTFTPTYERQRSALLLANGQVYMSFASFCDNGPYHGWIFSYNTQLQQTALYNDTANGLGGGIWGAGNALASDANGDIYTISGNGDFNLNTNGPNAGDAFIKLNPQLKLLDYFSPFNQLCLSQGDTDLGSGGPLLIPNTNVHIGAGKEGRIYVVSDSNMGKFTSDPNLSCSSSSTERLRTNIDKVVQELPPSTIGGDYSTPAYWNNTVYFTGAHDSIKAFKFSNGILSTTPTSHTAQTFNFTGGGSVVSSNGNDTSTGILWTLDPGAILRAYDASDLSKELYDTSMNASRDGMSASQFVKFTIPTVADGEVFVPTSNSLNIYGLLPTTPMPTPTGTTTPTPTTPTPTPTPGPVAFNNIGISDDTNPGSGNFDNAKNSYSSVALRNAGINGGDNAFYNGMVFTWPDANAGSSDNYIPKGQTIAVNPIANSNILGFLGASSNGPTIGQATIHYTDGSTQAITLGFSDWALGGGKQPISYGNGKMATLPYRNSPNGFQMVTNYVFYTDVAMQAGKTVASVTLPTTTVGGTMHIFAIATKVGTVATNPSPTIPYNNVGTSDDRAPASGNFDTINSYSAQATQAAGLIPGSTVNVYGTNFVWPASDPAVTNNYVVKGQTIPVTGVNNAGTLAFLGASTNGNSSGTVTITYTDADGITQTNSSQITFSDWVLGGGSDSPAAGDFVAISTPYRNTPGGKQAMNAYVFYTEIAIPADATLQSVTLPTTTTGKGTMHIFALSTRLGQPYTWPQYNNVGVSNDTNPTAAKFDGTKYSYSAQALQQAGIKPGNVIVVNGSTFIWPAAATAMADNDAATGQTIPVNAVYGSNYIAFLGASANGPAKGTATVTYTDGTTETIDLGFADWAQDISKVPTLSGTTQVAFSMPYRNGPGGKNNLRVNVFYYEVLLKNNLPIQSVTLPSSTTGTGSLHVFSITTR